MLILCYNAINNTYFRTEDKSFLRNPQICKATQGMDSTLIIEKWTLSDTGEEVLYKRTGTAIYENVTAVNFDREAYFKMKYDTNNKYITQIILPPELFRMLNINSPIFNENSNI